MNIDPSTFAETLYLGKLLEIFIYVFLGFIGTYYEVLIKYFMGVFFLSVFWHILFPPVIPKR